MESDEFRSSSSTKGMSEVTKKRLLEMNILRDPSLLKQQQESSHLKSQRTQRQAMLASVRHMPLEESKYETMEDDSKVPLLAAARVKYIAKLSQYEYLTAVPADLFANW